MSTIKSDNSDLTINASGTSKDIKFQADGTERMVLKSDGKLGVGTASPSAPLHVNGNSYLIAGSHGIEGNADPTNYLINTTSGILDIKWFGGVRFLTNGSTERMRVTSNGLCFNGDTAAANALDDYEEGTFTPGISFTGGGTATWNVRTGYYRKIGSLCYISMIVYPASLSGQSGYMQLNGLPFARTATGSGSDRDSGQIIYDRINTNGNGLIPFIDGNQSFCYVTSPQGSNGSASSSIGSGEIVGNSFMQVSITYITS
jgi:hypothetical protein